MFGCIVGGSCCLRLLDLHGCFCFLCVLVWLLTCECGFVVVVCGALVVWLLGGFVFKFVFCVAVWVLITVINACYLVWLYCLVALGL